MAFEGFDFAGFWDERSEYAEPPSEATVAAVEAELGYRLPASYVALMRMRNGGGVRRTCFPTQQKNVWGGDHIEIYRFWGIGHEEDSLCGDPSSQFMIEEWEYPPVGPCVAMTPAGGHAMIMLDYRACGPQGEPAVVHVTQGPEPEIIPLAESFEAFVRGLYVHPEEEDDEDDDTPNKRIASREAFEDFDLTDFWDEPRGEEEPPLTDRALIAVEAKLGVRLPSAYVELMARTQNGGEVKRMRFPRGDGGDDVSIYRLPGIGTKSAWSLCGKYGSEYMLEQWEYPRVGVCVGYTPSGGLDMIMLDYRACGRGGEPKVVHVEQGFESPIVTLAENFEAFVRGLSSQP